jgi:hypothetical protein
MSPLSTKGEIDEEAISAGTGESIHHGRDSGDAATLGLLISGQVGVLTVFKLTLARYRY